jgi:hypothetical protein
VFTERGGEKDRLLRGIYRVNTGGACLMHESKQTPHTCHCNAMHMA